MGEQPATTEKESEAENNQASRRNPLILFAGFMLLGVALALLLFGRDLFSGADSSKAASVHGSTTTILDQVSELPSLGESDQNSSGSLAGGVLDVGDKAFDFTLSDLDGNPVRLVDFRGHPVIINFWATWCAPCRLEMPALQEAFEHFRDDELVILALNQDEPAEVAANFFYDEMDLSFTPLLDVGSGVSTGYGSFGVLPTTYFVDPDGVISAIHRGPLTLNQIKIYLAGVLAGAS